MPMSVRIPAALKKKYDGRGHENRSMSMSNDCFLAGSTMAKRVWLRETSTPYTALCVPLDDDFD